MDAALLANMDRCPMYASFFGALGCACSIVFTTIGAAYGTAKSAGAIFSSGILRPDMLMQNTYETSETPSRTVINECPHPKNKADLSTAPRLCSIMAQILSIYGLVASVIISGGITEKMPIYTGFLQLGAGLAVGLCGMAAGFAIGIVGDAGGMLTTLMTPR
ncbi:V-type H+-transporting ATPase 16kDa proteolipid subunit [Ilyonectria robusta]